MQGPIQVYVAKYSYNPFEYSPNENPEAELQLNAGDYVLVHGDMDEVSLQHCSAWLKEFLGGIIKIEIFFCDKSRQFSNKKTLF